MTDTRERLDLLSWANNWQSLGVALWVCKALWWK